MLPSLHSVRNMLFHVTLVLTLAGAAVAQDSITVSPTKKDGTDIVTIRYKVDGDKKTKELTANVDLAKGIDGPTKAGKVKAAINAVHDPKITADVDATNTSTVKITGATGVTILSSNLSGASGEKRDAKPAIAHASCLFTTSSLGELEFVDGYGDLSTFTIGTARGEVEVTLLDYGSVQAAMEAALAELQDFGIDAWMPNGKTIEMSIDPELDQWACFGCTDSGVVQVSEMSRLDCVDCCD